MYTVSQIFRLGLLMGRNGPYTDKAGVLRQVRKMKHDIVIINGQRTYVVPLSEIVNHNAKKQKTVKIDVLETDAEGPESHH